MKPAAASKTIIIDLEMAQLVLMEPRELRIEQPAATLCESLLIGIAYLLSCSFCIAQSCFVPEKLFVHFFGV